MSVSARAVAVADGGAVPVPEATIRASIVPPRPRSGASLAASGPSVPSVVRVAV
ncbi:MAG: hypothetical protein IPF66_17895 [Holophagales bacterium]|nr:hypothetical protein [Holophagales bacterium]